MTRIAVIGAGIAGIACARGLKDAGYRVTLYEKSRGTGGRLATRRGGGGNAFDHGAQFVTVRGHRFAAAVTRSVSLDAATRWKPTGAKSLTVAEDWLVGKPGMSGLVKPLVEGQALQPGSHVSALLRGPLGWTLSTKDDESLGPYDVVVLAIPAPQASALLGDEHNAAFPALANARYDPCWALLVAHADKTPACADVIENTAKDAILGWVARDSAKPGRSARDTCWVAHASPAWSTTHLERDPDQVMAPLLEAFWAATGLDPARVRHTAAHRWRYARVAATAGQPFLWDGALSIGLCGDWCQGARVEAAFDSGADLAEAMVAALPAP